jgi:hypothetical protein
VSQRQIRPKYEVQYPDEKIKIFLPEKDAEIQKYSQRQRKVTDGGTPVPDGMDEQPAEIIYQNRNQYGNSVFSPKIEQQAAKKQPAVSPFHREHIINRQRER